VQVLLYGATGYTGALIARAAVQRGLAPILAGRKGALVSALAGELGLPHRAFALDDPRALDQGLADIDVVLHCAGPFVHTSEPMASACLRQRAHYLDVTGEIAVFEALAARDAEARHAGVMLMPGVGFDVVPSDCLALHLKQRLPTAAHLALGFHAGGGLSHGTAATMVENLGEGGLVRRGGVITRVPAAWKTRDVDFGDGLRTAVTIPWGDVATAYHSTGIPDIEVYLAMPSGTRTFLRLSRLFEPLLRTGLVRRLARSRIPTGGPSAAARARGRSLLWGEATDARGARAVSRLRGPEGYDMTVATALLVLERVLAGQAPTGYQTPSRAYGADLVLAVPGVERHDEPIDAPR
jgi:short subunit dehydrogenase-like uncharacterized protein